MSLLDTKKAAFGVALSSKRSASPTMSGSSMYRTIKRKKDNTGEKPNVLLLMTYIHEYLRAQKEPKKGPDIIHYLEQNGYLHEPSVPKNIINALRNQSVIKFIPDPQLSEQKWGSGTYEYLGRLGGIKDEVGLLAHLQAKKITGPLQYKELEDTWSECGTALELLERDHKIVIMREKGRPKHIFIDDATLHHKVAPEFLHMWQDIQVPCGKDGIMRLDTGEQKSVSTNHSRRAKGGVKKPRRKHGITTNIHMQHLLQDFSPSRWPGFI